MGGDETGVTDATTNVFIESAYFDPKRTARTGRRLNIQSDARFRFERGVDPDFVVPGLELATSMVLELCGGEAGKVEIAGKPPKPNAAVRLRSRPRQALERARPGAGEIKELLNALGIALTARANAQGGAALLAPRHFRPADLVEEVVRLVGVDRGAGDADAPRGRRGAAGADRNAERASAARAACLPRADWSRPSPGRSSRLSTRGCSAAARRS